MVNVITEKIKINVNIVNNENNFKNLYLAFVHRPLLHFFRFFRGLDFTVVEFNSNIFLLWTILLLLMWTLTLIATSLIYINFCHPFLFITAKWQNYVSRTLFCALHRVLCFLPTMTNRLESEIMIISLVKDSARHHYTFGMFLNCIWEATHCVSVNWSYENM